MVDLGTIFRNKQANNNCWISSSMLRATKLKWTDFFPDKIPLSVRFLEMICVQLIQFISNMYNERVDLNLGIHYYSINRFTTFDSCFFERSININKQYWSNTIHVHRTTYMMDWWSNTLRWFLSKILRHHCDTLKSIILPARSPHYHSSTYHSLGNRVSVRVYIIFVWKKKRFLFYIIVLTISKHVSTSFERTKSNEQLSVSRRVEIIIHIDSFEAWNIFKGKLIVSESLIQFI